VQFYQGSGLILRNGGEISNFTTGMTPRYWAWTIGCESPECPEGARSAEAWPSAKSARPIPAKIMNTPSSVRGLKNADSFVDFFFIRRLVEGCWSTSKYLAWTEFRMIAQKKSRSFFKKKSSR